MEYKNMSEERRQEIRGALSEHTWSIAYGCLAVIMFITAIGMAIRGKWIAAIAIWFLGQTSLMIGSIKHDRSHRVLDEH